MDASSPEDGRTPQAGTTLGGYRIERQLGRGGMGVVFLAYDGNLHRRVALKIVPESGASDDRLLREARNAAALTHPNICTVYEVANANGTAFIAMEYVEGRSLRERIDDGKLPTGDVLAFGIQAADALAYAHEHGVIHRDFKAANAIVTDAGRLKIVDFGLARRSDALVASVTTAPSIVPPGVQAGTPYAMAPEQVRGEPTDVRTDIWALGVLLYEMAGGVRPFAAAAIPELFSAILRDPPPALPSSMPAALKAVIERCLEKDPSRRYQHAADVRNALDDIARGLPSWAAWRYRFVNHAWLVAATATLAATALIVGLNVAGVRDRLRGGTVAKTPIRLVVLPFENLTGDPAQQYFSDGLTDEMITQLGRLRPDRLSVIARMSSMHYKNRDVSIEQIARELGVDYVLEGSARREGNRVRISATLIRARDQAQQWADTFEQELASILVLQNEVARRVADSLSLTLLPDQQAQLTSQRTLNPEAYENYLKGRFHTEKLTSPDFDLAQKYFEAALQKDRDNALAYSGIAFLWAARSQMGFAPARDAAPQSREAARKALDLDPTLPLAHHALGMAAWAEWDWETSERELSKAIELDPNNAVARTQYAHLLMALRRPAEAVAQAQLARQSDPLNALNVMSSGMILTLAGRYDQGIAEFDTALGMAPNMWVAHCGLVHAFNNAGRSDRILASAQACLGRYGDEVKDVLARGFAEAGYREAMRRAGDFLTARMPGKFVAPGAVFLAYSQARDKDRALEWLSKSVDAHDPNVYGDLRDPFIREFLGGDPRFREIVRRTKLPE